MQFAIEIKIHVSLISRFLSILLMILSHLHIMLIVLTLVLFLCSAAPSKESIILPSERVTIARCLFHVSTHTI